MAYTGKKPIDHTDVTQSQSMTVTDDLTVDTNTLHVDSTNNRVGILTTSPANATLDVAGRGRFLQDASATTGAIILRESSGGVGGHIQFVNNDNSGQRGFIAVDSSSNIQFGTSAERMRIESAGNVVQTATGAASWQYALSCTASSGQLLGHLIQFVGQTPNNASNYFLWMTDTTAARAYFKSDGGLANFQGNNANLSDEREKKNIEDAQDAWATVKSWQVRKFHFNEDADSDDKKYGVIAQEFQAHCPELITDYNKSPDPTSDPVIRLAVKEQGAMWLAIKALQEAQAKIETLETKVATLETQNADFETRLTALEAN